jgi:hypothetical protein
MTRHAGQCIPRAESWDKMRPHPASVGAEHSAREDRYPVRGELEEAAGRGEPEGEQKEEMCYERTLDQMCTQERGQREDITKGRHKINHLFSRRRTPSAPFVGQ